MYFSTNAFVALTYTAITLKFKCFPDEASYWAEKLFTDINLPPLMPDEDKNFGGSLVLDFKKMMTSRASQEHIHGPFFQHFSTKTDNVVFQFAVRMPSISKIACCADRSILTLLSAYLVTFKLLTSQVVQRARPFRASIVPIDNRFFFWKEILFYHIFISIINYKVQCY